MFDFSEVQNMTGDELLVLADKLTSKADALNRRNDAIGRELDLVLANSDKMASLTEKQLEELGEKLNLDRAMLEKNEAERLRIMAMMLTVMTRLVEIRDSLVNDISEDWCDDGNE